MILELHELIGHLLLQAGELLLRDVAQLLVRFGCAAYQPIDLGCHSVAKLVGRGGLIPASLGEVFVDLSAELADLGDQFFAQRSRVSRGFLPALLRVAEAFSSMRMKAPCISSLTTTRRSTDRARSSRSTMTEPCADCVLRFGGDHGTASPVAALSANLLDPRLEEDRVQSFRDQLKTTLAAETRRALEAASQDSQLKEELAGLKKEQQNLVDGITKHGFSPALSARLAAVESRIAQIQKLRTAGVEPKVPEFTTEVMREFVQRKSQEFANILAGDAAIAREQLRKRITKLVFTPKRTQNGSVFEVTGDVSLFQGNGDVMLSNSLEGIAEHYIQSTIPLKSVILDPSLDLTA